MKKYSLLLISVMLVLQVLCQETITGKISISWGKPKYSLNKKITEKVSPEVYFTTLEGFGKVIANSVYTNLQSKKIPNCEFQIETNSIVIDSLPFVCKDGFLKTTGSETDCWGENETPTFTITGGGPNPGWPKLFKDLNTKPEIFNQNTDFTIVIWAILSTYFKCNGSGCISAHSTNTILMYAVYNSKTGKMVGIDYLQAQDVKANSDMKIAYQELVEKATSKFVEKITKNYFK
jgi:hypothetical protein